MSKSTGPAVAALGLLALALLSAGPAPAAEPAVPPAPAGFAPLFDELVAMSRRTPLTPVDWMRGSVVVVQLSNYGSAALPYVRARFGQAASEGEAMVSGAYLAVHGVPRDHATVRRELETNRRKRVWLLSMVGDDKAMTASVQQGAQWKPAVQMLPSLSGCQNLSMLCMRSDDVLVRRAGMYWGFWVSNAAYWEAVRGRTESDPDSLTRRFARYLIRKRGEDTR